MPLSRIVGSERTQVHRQAASSSGGVIFYTLPAGRRFVGRISAVSAGNAAINAVSGGVPIQITTAASWEPYEFTGPMTFAPSSSGQPAMVGYEE